MGMIKTFNQTVSKKINKQGDFYEVMIGKEEFTPEVVIDESSDYNCGALCNELEYARVTAENYYKSFDIDVADSGNLDLLVNGFIDLPRRNIGESDSTFRKRFKFIIEESMNYRRTTKWALLDAMRHFMSNVDTNVQIIEIFDSYNLFFEIRIEGAEDLSTALFLNNTEQGYLDLNYVGGAGVGEIMTYLGEMIDRIKAAGVDYDILFIEQSRFTKLSDTIIGTVQKYLLSDAKIKAAVSFTKTSDAVIV